MCTHLLCISACQDPDCSDCEYAEYCDLCHDGYGVDDDLQCTCKSSCSLAALAY